MRPQSREEFRYRKLVRAAMTDHLPQVAGVYKLVNWVTGQCYVGSTINLRRRCLGHVGRLLSRKHHSFALQESFDKFGMPAFAFVVIDLCPSAELAPRERKWFAELSPYFCTIPPTSRRTQGRQVSILIRADDFDRLQHAAQTEQKSTLLMLGSLLDSWESNGVTHEKIERTPVAAK